jgi:hypothetical protein
LLLLHLAAAPPSTLAAARCFRLTQALSLLLLL